MLRIKCQVFPVLSRAWSVFIASLYHGCCSLSTGASLFSLEPVSSSGPTGPLHLLFLLPGTFLPKITKCLAFFTASRSFWTSFHWGGLSWSPPLNSTICLNLPMFLAIHPLFSVTLPMSLCILHLNVSSVKPARGLHFTVLCLTASKSMLDT